MSAHLPLDRFYSTPGGTLCNVEHIRIVNGAARITAKKRQVTLVYGSTIGQFMLLLGCPVPSAGRHGWPEHTRTVITVRVAGFGNKCDLWAACVSAQGMTRAVCGSGTATIERAPGGVMIRIRPDDSVSERAASLLRFDFLWTGDWHV